MEPQLHGRADAIPALQASRGVTLVAGDSGVGKTALVELVGQTVLDKYLVSEVKRVRGITGSLARAITEGLIDCLHHHASQHPMTTQVFWRRVAAVALRAGKAGGRQMGQLALDAVAGYLRNKVGADAVAVAQSALTEVFKPDATGLSERLHAHAGPDALQQLADFVRGAMELVDRKIYLLLDDADRLSPDDRALLRELAAEDLGGAAILVAINSGRSEGAEIVRRFRAECRSVHEVGPLDSGSLRRWLASTGVERRHWDTVQRLTSGYPLLVADAIRTIEAGGSLSTTPLGNSPFSAVLEAAWRRLEDGPRTAAMRLAAFTDPPPDGFLATYLELTIVELSNVRNRLLDEGIFIRFPDGSSWFHERRRTHTWDHILGRADRAEVALRALQSFDAWVRSRSYIEAWLYSSTAALNRALPDEERQPFMSAMLTVSDDELKLLWALIEVIEPKGERGMLAGTAEVVRYASERTAFSGDPLKCLETLQDRGLLTMVSNDHDSLLGLVIPSVLAQANLVGEIEDRFFVRPVPNFASAAFKAFLESDLRPFTLASISLGKATPFDIRDSYVDLERSSGNIRNAVRPGLGCWFAVEGQHISVTMTFDDESERQVAERHLLAMDASLAGAERVRLDRMIRLPPSRIRWSRHRQLHERLSQQGSRDFISDEAALLRHLDARMAISVALSQTLPTHEAAALRLGRDRRYMANLQDTPGTWAVLEIRGSTGDREASTFDVSDEAPLIRDPLLELRLRAAGKLEASEGIARTSVQYRADGRTLTAFDEVVAAIEEDGRRFNRSLAKINIVLDPQSLEDQIGDHLSWLASTEERLLADGLIHRPSENRDDSVLILLTREPRHGWTLDGWMASYCWLPDGARRARVVIDSSAEPPSWSESLDTLQSLFGVPISGHVFRRGQGDATGTLARLLGWDIEDVVGPA